MARRPALLFFLSFLLHLASAVPSTKRGLARDEFPNLVPDYAFGLKSRQAACPTPDPGASLCDKDTKCADGSCCNECGVCGYGPTYCGEGNCTSNCEAKAMCGVYGDLTVNNGACGMGLCCSASGWCGTTEAHCVGTPDAPCQSDHGPCAIAVPKKCGADSGTTNKRTIAYYQAVGSYNRICNSIKPSNIDTTKFTHLYYAFVSINPETYEIAITDKDKEIIPEFTVLNATLKTWVAIGGFDFSEPANPTHTTWSDLVSSEANRKAFITSLIDFMDVWGFSGADLDWEFPVEETRGGKKTDTANLVLLVKEMRERFGTKYGISMAIPIDYSYLRWFDLFSMQQYVDFFGFMAYDLHGFGDGANIDTTTKGQAGIDEIQEKTAPLYFDKLDFDKINFGLAYYGRGYTLADPTTCKELGCTVTGPSNAAECTKEKGVMSLTEIQKMIETEGITPTLLGPQMMKSIQWADQWIGYDDDETFAMKKTWADDYCFGGTMAWSVDFYSGPGNSNSDPGNGNTPPTTTDGTCGKDHDYTMCGNGFGSCCSGAGCIGGWAGTYINCSAFYSKEVRHRMAPAALETMALSAICSKAARVVLTQVSVYLGAPGEELMTARPAVVTFNCKRDSTLRKLTGHKVLLYRKRHVGISKVWEICKIGMRITLTHLKAELQGPGEPAETRLPGTLTLRDGKYGWARKTAARTKVSGLFSGQAQTSKSRSEAVVCLTSADDTPTKVGIDTLFLSLDEDGADAAYLK
ncbi:hypothetical protein V494_01266 [Pseudogymnoascus sp. VKM F-4513 (FW-928)]|nr:hypothetical protein V494_01266 [Pseudogymnoascus sp. VKM F-4513 (FW-928)]